MIFWFMKLKSNIALAFKERKETKKPFSTAPAWGSGVSRDWHLTPQPHRSCSTGEHIQGKRLPRMHSLPSEAGLLVFMCYCCFYCFFCCFFFINFLRCVFEEVFFMQCLDTVGKLLKSECHIKLIQCMHWKKQSKGIMALIWGDLFIYLFIYLYVCLVKR